MEEDIRKGVGRQIWRKHYALMYENGKMRPVETIPGMEEGRGNGEQWMGEFNYDMW
jgi:hypothetical protein